MLRHSQRACKRNQVAGLPGIAGILLIVVGLVGKLCTANAATTVHYQRHAAPPAKSTATPAQQYFDAVAPAGKGDPYRSNVFPQQLKALSPAWRCNQLSTAFISFNCASLRQTRWLDECLELVFPTHIGHAWLRPNAIIVHSRTIQCARCDDGGDSK